MAARPVVKLGLHIGHVLSRELDTRVDDHRAVDEGTYPFVLLFIMTYGADNLYVISRTNAASNLIGMVLQSGLPGFLGVGWALQTLE